MTVFIELCRTVLNFVCELWILSKRLKNKLQAVKIKYPKRVIDVVLIISLCRS